MVFANQSLAYNPSALIIWCHVFGVSRGGDLYHMKDIKRLFLKIAAPKVAGGISMVHAGNNGFSYNNVTL